MSVIEPGTVPLSLLRAVYEGSQPARLAPQVWDKVNASRTTIEERVADGGTYYGINTGFGLLANTRIANDDLAELQKRLVLSHACGTGEPLDDRTVRLVLALKVISLARGHSGVRPVVVEALLRLIESEIYPVIPGQGSVGASGDLAPLAHMSAALLGVGEMRHRSRVMSAAEGLALAEIQPLVLEAKEGLALLNGTQVSTALALSGLFAIESVFAAGLVAGALSTDALKGSVVPHDPRIHAARGQPGQMHAAATIRHLLDGSAINASHAGCGKVQDPYSLRCQPQVMGACLDIIRSASATLQVEANAATDNPLIFTEDNDILSGGNFHAEPIAFAADILAMAACEVGSISERRTAILVDPKMSGLPAFLVEESGLNSGFMIAQVTAAALVAENKQLAHPASVDSLPTSANQEDHVSMATHGARRLKLMAGNAAAVVAIELLAAAQGVEFHAPLATSEPLREVLRRVREVAPHYDHDRYFAPDIAGVRALVEAGTFREFVPDLPSGA
ncbi:histidine ammonia-lyase [Sphingomonas sp. ID1715]|uniref:histidine ammonia-lyase n=1 Tax=Sphingomonas sp. ID1715 TaxID=1656898 RepID=UPI001487FC7F|nr:histidine ammonia-lyase [Sphingomonas sp. ID1715]NNM75583.1 histidine ammonia-lyase [Sphingomonas sp. ID1715]